MLVAVKTAMRLDLFTFKLKCSYFSSPAAAFCSSGRKGPICLARTSEGFGSGN